jgi:hypothetical protein
MNKKLLSILCVLMLLCGLSVVAAADLTNHDFTTFKMDIPNDANLTEETGFNGKDVIENAVRSNGGSIPVSDLESDPANTHPVWTDNVNNISIQFINCEEDKLSNHANAMKQMYANSTFKEDSGNLHIYDMSKVSGEGSYGVCVENNGKSVVVITGDDLDLLKKMGESVKFN